MEYDKNIAEKKAPASNGIVALLLILAGFIIATAFFVFGIIFLSNTSYAPGGIMLGAWK